MNMTADDLKMYLTHVIAVIEENKDYLSELDRKLGDGDHGVTMSIGWQAIGEQLRGALKDEQDCAKICTVAGRAFLSAAGSSVGPLYAMGFLRGAKAIQNVAVLRNEDLVRFWVAFMEGIKERGKAEIGDKTMIDTLEPAVTVLQIRYRMTGEFRVAFADAVAAGRRGMEATKDIMSRKGRSSRLGERSLGIQDPGATSAFLILRAFLDTINAQVES
ncbi:dihydroxyacetone kinase subunit DhaL [Paenibacillus thiaminolyticus]|uniref:phosphoenolpyruvate--glycerone phosphotransferase n=1 Tax=Paenibacillus thiaminolyticus TaxID=49283 RepID=A0AAP9J3X0_PANTH|nr:dihydroxyacetone kinase subunit DhaL [Paenibacillus thiaminolyticus]MCY9537652.1 dihydroxyacetone kinase subunit DhaL [Paenibacillus thiaminolyticus]MCY9601733.1 dihydroxyacetone kinase subunit DhaL [Paenibacillus thiaminolyticus]MCY9607135.1 dihydroxyacetone kinase subunit DhaL [Paenibacillus thiaminolyticus]MCY9614177.1 dihydroxyacetone kinase subunit DhaL [Paenibacillus thiaminolyticus]MCY9619266.1 dihydroxyacetone kinase subunit DhaL [Paenibacillus thiaminolyticus]